MEVEGFDWNAGNAFKSEAKHGIAREAIESLFQKAVWVAPDPKHSKSEERFLAIATLANEKHVIVAFTFRFRSGKRLIRPISARYMNKREIKRYEENFAQNKE